MVEALVSSRLVAGALLRVVAVRLALIGPVVELAWLLVVEGGSAVAA